MATREDYIYYARLAEQGERYEDMIKYMKIVAEVSLDINLQTDWQVMLVIKLWNFLSSLKIFRNCYGGSN